MLAEAQRLTGETSPSKAVNRALSELVRRHKLMELRQMLGTLDIEDDWREAEKRELKDMARSER